MSKVPRWVWFTVALAVPSVALAATGADGGACAAICGWIGCACGAGCPCGG